MHVIILVSNSCLTDSRIFNESRTLIDAGYNVLVLAWDREGNLESTETVDGVEVVRLRTPLPPKFGIGKIPWHLLHLILWQLKAYRKILALHKRKPVNIVHCQYFHALPVTAALKCKLGIQVIYDTRDIYEYLLHANGLKWVAPLFSRLEKFLVKQVDSLITVSEPTRCYFNKITDKPVTVIMNCKKLSDIEYKVQHKNNVFSLIYIGILHPVRHLDMLLNAVTDLPGVRCIISGIGDPDYIDELKAKITKINNVSFIGMIPFVEVLPMTQESDAVFCLVDPFILNTSMTMPNKIFEAMICGKPIIGTKGTFSGEFIQRENIGLAIEFNETALREAIVKLRDNPELCEQIGGNALKAAHSKYNWELEQEKLLALYSNLQRKSC